MNKEYSAAQINRMRSARSAAVEYHRQLQPYGILFSPTAIVAIIIAALVVSSLMIFGIHHSQKQASIKYAALKLEATKLADACGDDCLKQCADYYDPWSQGYGFCIDRVRHNARERGLKGEL